jgi:iron complex transport system substrate-binding protein
VARLVGKQSEGLALVEGFQRGLDEIAAGAKLFPRRPRVYFEEWPDPLISGIAWVEELIEIAGGEPVFPELRNSGKAQDRVVDPAEVVKRNPAVILASWCGKKVNKKTMASRPGWDLVAAVRDGHIYEIKSAYILQPGPASLTDGVRQIHAILAQVAGADAGAAANRAER